MSERSMRESLILHFSWRSSKTGPGLPGPAARPARAARRTAPAGRGEIVTGSDTIDLYVRTQKANDHADRPRRAIRPSVRSVGPGATPRDLPESDLRSMRRPGQPGRAPIARDRAEVPGDGLSTRGTPVSDEVVLEDLVPVAPDDRRAAPRAVRALSGRVGHVARVDVVVWPRAPPGRSAIEIPIRCEVRWNASTRSIAERGSRSTVFQVGTACSAERLRSRRPAKSPCVVLRCAWATPGLNRSACSQAGPVGTDSRAGLRRTKRSPPRNDPRLLPGRRG
jgi:hypothetical protein